MSDDPTTARAQRRQAVAEGTESDAVDRASPRSDPRGRNRETTTRRRQQQLARDVAEDIDIGREGVGTVDRIGGMDVFLRSPGVQQFGDNVRRDFSSEADFVERDDVDPRVDAQEISAAPIVADNRRDDVGRRARRETAADAQWIESRDLQADVGEFGVRGITVAEDRRDDVADRARQDLASEDPYAEPGDFGISVTESGVEDASLTDQGARRRAGRQFTAETPLRDVDPTEDVTPADDGFALTGSAQRRVAARKFESDVDLFGTGELDPSTDIRDIDDGFGLGRGPAREVAAADLDAQFPEYDIGPSDIELQETESGEYEGVFEREVSR